MGCGCSSALQVRPQEVPQRDWFSPIPRSSQAHAQFVRGDHFHDLYILGPMLGRGSFGQVHRTLLKTDRREAKAVKIMTGRCRTSGREASLLQRAQSPNVVELYDIFEESGSCFIVMQLCFGGTLQQRFEERGEFDETETIGVGRQVLLALEHIHNMYIVHRDIKADNFMLAEKPITSEVKLIDFGLACEFRDGQKLTRPCGCVRYLAPEVSAVGEYGCEVDLWAAGVLLYLLLYGIYPHGGAKTQEEILRHTVYGRVEFQNTVSRECIHFLKQLLEPRPQKRNLATQALGHPWVTTSKRCTGSDSFAEGSTDYSSFGVAEDFRAACSSPAAPPE
eukprot:TRINITY_DN6905_c0_g1_i3.p1 TRINITY_DN6905_c0_g1~~TRINITY_DN6905_c0_g1_i3.p1  ORF type:complete len:358 (-),score=49.72 TRINITY_DN6905_c0_g1_i3:647-1651(-)